MISVIFYFISFVFSIYCCLISRRKFGFWLNHYVLTNFWWLLTLGVSIFLNNYIQPISEEVYLIFFVGLGVFNSTILNAKIQKLSMNIPYEVYSLKRRRIIELIILLAIVPIAYKNLTLLQSGVELWRINDAYWRDESVRGTYWELFYKENIIAPLSTIIMTTCFFKEYSDGNRVSIFITILIGVSLAFLDILVTGGGRTVVLRLSFIVILSYMTGRILKFQNLMVDIKLKFVFIALFFVFLGILMSSKGRGQEEGLLTVLLERLTLPPALFEGWYMKTDVCQEFTLGTSMFETPLSIISYPLKSFGIGFGERISALEQKSMFAPALGQNSNACVTAFLYYMRDFGYFGIIIGPYLVAKIYNYIWKLCRSNIFMLVFYFTAINITCLETIYPFNRGFMFVLIFVFLFKKFITVKSKQPL